MRTHSLALLAALALAIGATKAQADPCKAIPDRGPMPDYLGAGARFTGPVAYVGDGDSLCVAVGPGPDAWVEVRLADFYAPELAEAGGIEAKATLARIAQGKRVECVAQHRSYDRVVAVCRLDSVSLGDRMRRTGVREGGRGE